MKKLIILLLIFIISFSSLLSQDAQKTISGLKKELDKINKYTVRAKINLDVDFINIKDREIEIEYKKGEQLTINSDGFAMLPKNGSATDIQKILSEDYTAVFSKYETYKSKKLEIIKIIPMNSDKSGLVIMEVAIDPLEYKVYKSEVITKEEGQYKMYFEYDKQIKYNLPKKLTIEFNIQDMKIPGYMVGEFDKLDKKEETNKVAKVVLTYYDYKIN